MLDKTRYREAMSRLGAAVNVITTAGPAGRSGLTASAVCSVTDEPATLLVCINRSSRTYAAFVQNNVLCVNTLAPDHQELSRLFSSPTDMEARFAAADWTQLETGSPVLLGASVAFDCTISQISEVGSHGVLFCRVQNVEVGPGQSGLIYMNRAYHGLMVQPRTETP